jgi:hypothetical protein
LYSIFLYVALRLPFILHFCSIFKISIY